MNFDLFEALFNQSNFPVTILEANPPYFTIVALNDQSKRNRTNGGNDIGKNVFEVYKPWDEASERQFALMQQALNEAVREKRQVNLPIIYLETAEEGKPAVKAWWQIEINPIFDADRKVTHLASITRNVTETELKRLAAEEANKREEGLREELASANEELAATNEELTASNEELNATLEELTESQTSLVKLNELLEQKVALRTNELALKVDELAHLADLYQFVINNIPQQVWTAEPNGSLDFVNTQTIQYFGKTARELVGENWIKVVHPDDLEAAGKAWMHSLQTGEPYETEFRLLSEDNNYTWHLARAVPYYEKGRIIKWFGSNTDIEIQKQLVKSKDDFISIASHELKTPITALKASLQLLDKLKHNPLSPVLPKLIDQGNKSIVKITSLVDDLLNTGRLTEGQLHLKKSSFTIAKMLAGCCNHVRTAGTHELILQGDEELTVYADEHQVEQVVVNMVNNAVKYAPGSTRIYLVIEKEGDKAKISVKDEGPGIEPEKAPYLFDRYYRSDYSGTQYSGLGLGLYISAEIVRKHGGQIGVESKPGSGSTFWFTLPLV